MQRIIACLSMLITLLTVLAACSLVSAQTVVLPQTNRGSYHESIGRNPHGTYIVGDFRPNGGGKSCYPGCGADYRNYFVFDLAGLTQPILSAQLEVFLSGAAGGFSSEWYSADPSENYQLHDVVTSIAALLDGTGGVAAHTDLGSGVVYRSRTTTATDMGTVVVIPLNASAIAALEPATGLFAMGGSITTLDAVANAEFVFGSPASTDIIQLRLTVVPEPSTLVLLGLGAISLLGYRKAKSDRRDR
jgi:hypothetical protein